MVEKYKSIEGQCGTCAFAAAFDYAEGNQAGPEDGVHCTSIDHAKALDDSGDNYSLQELVCFGFMDLLRLEFLAEETFSCSEWRAKEK